MSAPTHSTRHPHRISEINSRTPLGLFGRHRVAAAPLRKAIYYGPLGQPSHIVTNPHSGERYVVADGLGGATLQRGTPVVLASFGGQHGEVLISRPPAGYGGSAVIASQALPNVIPVAAEPDPVEPDVEFTRAYYAICYSPDGDEAFIAAVDTADDSSYKRFKVLRVDRDDMPHVSQEVETEIYSLEIGSLLNFYFNGMTYLGSNAFLMCYDKETSSGVYNVNLVQMTRLGSVSASVNYDTDGKTNDFSSILSDGNLFTIEPIVTQDNSSSNPSHNNKRLVKRSTSGGLSLTGSYDFGNPTSKTPFASLQYSGPVILREKTGGVECFLLYQKNPTGGDDQRIWLQAFDTAPAEDGSDTVCGTGGPLFSAGLGSTRYKSSLGVVAYSNDEIGFWDGDSVFTTFQSGLDTDGAENLQHMDVISDTEFVLLGTGSGYVTSIVTSSGQELP